jgi:hypothetical protein
MKDIPGYEGYYAATEDGKIWSYRKNNFLSICINSSGYAQVTLWDGKQGHSERVNRLVALAYLPNPENKPTVDHINRNRSDNSVKNLRWATWEEQAKNKTRPSEIKPIQNNFDFEEIQKLKEKYPVPAHNAKPIEMRDNIDHTIIYQIFDSASQAAEILFKDKGKRSFISKCARGIKPSAYGYYWTFVDKEKSLTPEAGCGSSEEVTNDNTV